MSGPKITIARKSGAAALIRRVFKSTQLGVYLGIPSDGTKRKAQLLAMSDKTTSKRRKAKLVKAAGEDVSNAELLFIHTKGSPQQHIPARPVLEPAVAADGNRQAIGHELAESVKLSIAGDDLKSKKRIRRAGLAGQNAARKWFTDPRNNWAPNRPATIARKGSDKPLIDTGALRAAITYVVKEE